MIEPKQNVKKITRLVDTEERKGFIRLDRNERVTPFPPKMMAEFLSRISAEDLMRYPIAEPLYHKMAAWLGIERDGLLLTYGSDGAIRSVFEVYVNPGDRIVMPYPTYAMYTVYANLFQANACKLAYDRNLTLTVEHFCRAITPETRLVILPNPNSPTGTVFSQAEMEMILEKAASVEALTLVDEAYYYFHDQTMLGYVKDYENLLVTRTFSKAAGLAGLRIGYVVGQPSLIQYLMRVKPTYEINGVGQRLTEYMIEHEEFLWQSAHKVKEGQAFLKRKFESKGLKVFECPTNFMVVRLPSGFDRSELVRRLAEARFLIKGTFRDQCLADCIRITSGPVTIMSEFWQVFEKIYDELAS